MSYEEEKCNYTIVFIVLIKITIDLNSPGSSVQIAAGEITNSITYKIYDNQNCFQMKLEELHSIFAKHQQKRHHKSSK